MPRLVAQARPALSEAAAATLCTCLNKEALRVRGGATTP